MIRTVTLDDAAQLAALYNFYIRTSVVTFEEVEIGSEEMANRIQRIHFIAGFPYIVYEIENQIVGYAYANTWRERNAYRFTVESTVYVASGQFGKGIGSALYSELIAQVKQKGYRAVIGGIALPNYASVILHEQFGFKRCGVFKNVGFKFDQWIDVGFWQLEVE